MRKRTWNIVYNTTGHNVILGKNTLYFITLKVYYKSKTIIFFVKYTKKVTMNVTFHNILNIFLEVVLMSNYAYKCTGKQSLQLVNF